MKSLSLLLALLIAWVPLLSRAEEPTLHDFDTVFIDQNGAESTLATHRGQPVLITLFYGNCAWACPLLVRRMKKLEAKLPESIKREMRMVLVTLDPKNDSVPRLKELQRAYVGEDSRWSFLRVEDPDAVQELAAVLGVKYRFMPDGSINHSSVITLLDRDGVSRARMDGMGQADETILDALPLHSPSR